MSQTHSHPQAVSLNDLVLSPLNVRKTPPSAAEQEELKASLSAHGLLENLVVRAADDGRFEVLAGGRRLAALQALADEGRIHTDYPVRCLIHDGDPSEVSLAENVVRLSMHALDQFEAFAALADQGMSPADIAHRFGHSEKLVRQRLRLGRVASEIREAYRNEEISLDVLMAFAVTDDAAQQLAVWAEIGGGYIHAQQVRRLLTEEKIAASSKYVRVVGQEAYEAAGGTVSRDLFSDDDDALWLEDRALVMRLVQEKLEAAADSLKTAEGWKWVQTIVDLAYDAVSACQTVYPKSADPTSDQEAEIERLADRLQEIEREADADSWTQERLQAFEDGEGELAAIEDALRAYAPEDLARAGCIVSVGHNGELAIKRGLVLPEDQVNDKGANASATATGPFSAALKDDLGHARLAVAQRHLAVNFACAFDAMLFSMARSVLTLGHSDKPLDLTLSTTLPYNWAERSGGQAMEVPKDIDLSWLDLSAEEGFRALAELPMEAKQRLFAHCAAVSLKGRLGDGEADLFAMIGARLGVDMAAHWRPTAETFWKRVKKGYALEAAAEVLGEAWSRVHKDDKKAVLAETLETVFSGQRTVGITAEQAAAARWLPDGMGFAVNEPGETTSPTVSVKTQMPEDDDLPEAFRVPAAE